MKRVRHVPTRCVSRPSGTPCPNLETVAGQGLPQPSQPLAMRACRRAHAPAGRRAYAPTPVTRNRLGRLVRLGQASNAKGFSVPTPSQPRKAARGSGLIDRQLTVSPAKRPPSPRVLPSLNPCGYAEPPFSRRDRRGRISSQAACEQAVSAPVNCAATGLSPVRATA